MVTDASVFQYSATVGECLSTGAGGRLERSNRSSPAHSNFTNMMSHVSRHARVSGDCPVCLFPLQGRALTKRPCGHLLCSPCFLDARERGYCDANFNADRCELCRNEVVTKTRTGGSLMEHFPSSKQLVVTPTTKPSDKPRGTIPREGPSSGTAGSAGADKRAGHPKRLKEKKRKSRDEKEVGGFFLEPRGKARLQGISIPA